MNFLSFVENIYLQYSYLSPEEIRQKILEELAYNPTVCTNFRHLSLDILQNLESQSKSLFSFEVKVAFLQLLDSTIILFQTIHS